MILDDVDVLYLEDGNAYGPVLKNKPQLFFFLNRSLSSFHDHISEDPKKE